MTPAIWLINNSFKLFIRGRLWLTRITIFEEATTHFLSTICPLLRWWSVLRGWSRDKTKQNEVCLLAAVTRSCRAPQHLATALFCSTRLPEKRQFLMERNVITEIKQAALTVFTDWNNTIVPSSQVSRTINDVYQTRP